MATPKRTTAPAFQFYPKDFLTSPKVRRMSMTERGVYITLLCLCWLDGSLTTELRELADECRLPLKQFSRLWQHSIVSQCFIEKDGRFYNERLNEERRKQAEYKRRQTDNIAKRWNAQRAASGNTVVLPTTVNDQASGNTLRSSSSSSSSSASSTAKKKERTESAEPPSDSTPVIVTFPTVGKPPSWDLRQSQIDKWVDTFPNVNVEFESRKALAWVEAHMDKRKTARGMAGFLVSWLGRAADRPASSPSGGGSGSTRTAGNADALRQFVERGRTM